jgi:hypothetical protein
MLNVIYAKCLLLSVAGKLIMLGVVMLSVVAPYRTLLRLSMYYLSDIFLINVLLLSIYSLVIKWKLALNQEKNQRTQHLKNSIF